MLIRDVTPDDWPLIWPFLHRICAEGETFSYPTDMAEEQGRAYWLLDAPGRTVVAVEGGAVLGTAKMNPNQMGNAAHVSSASFMVDPAHSGQGVGRALCAEALRWAGEQGYRGMQFNAVVASNTPAVRLYTSLGFRVIGTVPEGFRHPRLGYVGLHIMYREL
ncbi:Ribosomal protein S18 acetylase RimI [Streptomyces sp. DvalAA-14]|uniref:GNAT family N-acetyltransferase n=1 Tax=unclassified Streptomyces TaxID=2593676 RepID=UPI00081BA4B3|nr:GNAT family N-acetyltransferase [Streptomyces sp. DvalAA-14]MYS24763.1 GNAT family N-acetyltransferase [Streptomyces sp. SID4948]SCE49131.1 Ribosomal protein S18 acetylase RimI [Streptomyces sp. DvalAA-14]